MVFVSIFFSSPAFGFDVFLVTLVQMLGRAVLRKSCFQVALPIELM